MMMYRFQRKMGRSRAALARQHRARRVWTRTFNLESLEPRCVLASAVPVTAGGAIAGDFEPFAPIVDPFSAEAVSPLGLARRAELVEHVPGQLVVALRGSEEAVADLLEHELPARLGMGQLHASRPILSYAAAGGELTSVVTVEMGPTANVAAAMQRLTGTPHVLWSSPNFVYDRIDPREAVPSDPLFGNQYHHALMETPAAWDVTFGDPSIVVAVTDDGLDLTHPDLAAGIWVNTDEIANNGVDDDNNGYVDDVHGWDFVDLDNDPNPNAADFHGTHVTGIAAARTNNGVGIAGTAGSVSIMPLKFFDGLQVERFTSDVIAEAFAYAVDNGARIVNTSYSIDFFVGDPVFAAGLQYVYERGAIHFNSAGNNNEQNPARVAFEQSLIVASTGGNDKRSSFSNFGTGIDLSAPGRGILSTLKNNNYGTLSGTSMAAPNAAGVAALIWSAQPNWTRDQVAAQLLGTTDDIDDQNKGQEGLLGTGRVNARRALTETLPPPQVSSLTGLPADGGLITSVSTTQFQVEFSHLMDPASVTASNFELRHAGDDRQFDNDDDVVFNLSLAKPYLIGTNQIVVRIDDGPLDFGDYRLTVRAGGLQNPFETPLDGNADGLGGDDLVRYFRVAPRAMTPVSPLGGLIYETEFFSSIDTAGEVDHFFFEIDAGQRFSVNVTTDGQLSPRLQIIGPTGDAVSPVAGAGSRALLQNVDATEAGTYELEIWGDANTTGSYQTELLLNAAFEEEALKETGNSYAPSAEDLDATALNLGAQGAQRMGVVGSLAGFFDTRVDGDDFETGGLGPRWTTASSSSRGEVIVSSDYDVPDGDFALFMAVTNGNFTSGNEAVWSLDLSSAVSPRLRFQHASWDDTLDPLPSTYTGTVLGDGVAISADGATWHRALEFTPQVAGEWQQYEVDLEAAATAAGIPLSSDFRIKFQNLGSGTVFRGGRAFDDIEILQPDTGEDWYRFTLADGESISLAAASAAQTELSLSVIAPDGMTLLATAASTGSLTQVISDFTDTTTDGVAKTYYARLAGEPVPYGLVATRNAALEWESGEDTASQPITSRGVLGFVAAPLQRQAEPNDFPVGNTLNTVFDDVVLSRQLGGEVVVVPDPTGVTGANRVFGYPVGGSRWAEGGEELRADFAQPVNFVSIDVAADTGQDMAVLRVFDSAGKLLGETFSDVLNAGQFETISIHRSSPDIAYAIATGAGNESVLLDNLVFELREGDDTFALFVSENDTLSITAFLPGGGPFDPQNTLAESPDSLQLTLFDPQQNQVATGTNGITYPAGVSGRYELHVASSEGRGEYFLDIAGSTASPPLDVVRSFPADGQLLAQFPASYTLELSDSALVGSVEPADLTVNGIPATAVESVRGHVATFTLDPAANAGPGIYTVALAANAIEDLQGDTNLAWSADFAVDELQPFERLDPAGGLAFVSRQNSLVLADEFDQVAVSFATQPAEQIAALATPEDASVILTIQLDGGTGPITASGPGQPVLLPLSPTATQGLSTLLISADGGTGVELDVYRNVAISALGNMTATIALEPRPEPLAGRRAAVGALHGTPRDLLFERYTDPAAFVDISGTGNPLDVQDDAAAGIVTLVGNALFPSGPVSVGNNGGIVAGSSLQLPLDNHSLPAPHFSGPALLPMWDDLADANGNVYWEERLVGGINTLIVQWHQRPHFDVGGTATFQLQVFESGPVSARFAYQDVTFGDSAYDFAGNATIGYQRDQTEAWQFSHLSGVLADGDVIDLLFTPQVVDVDVFEIDLTAGTGQLIDVVADGLDADIPSNASVELWDPQGQLVATATPYESANFDLGIFDFPVSSSGAYTLHISSDQELEYSLLVTEDLVWDAEPNDRQAALRRLDGVRGAIGFTSAEDVYEIKLTAGEVVLLATQTPFDDQFASPGNTLDPQLVVIDALDHVVASDADSLDGHNARLAFTSPADGIYRVAVGAESGQGEYFLKATSPGVVDADFNEDGRFDCADIDAVVNAIVAGSQQWAFDLNDDDLVDLQDVHQWLVDAASANGYSSAYLPGDANLSHAVDVSDFNAWNSAKFRAAAGWCRGDFNADGFADVGDFNIWNGNKFKAIEGTVVTIRDASAQEGDALIFEVALSNPVNEDIVLRFSTSNGSATGGDDYEQEDFEYSLDGGVSWLPANGASGTSVTVSPGLTSFLLRIDSAQDVLDESVELFSVDAVATAPANGVVRDVREGTGQIFDDDPTPTIVISNAQVREGTDQFAQFRVELTTLSAADVQLDLSLTEVNARGNGVDFGSTEADRLQVSRDGGQTWQNSSGAVIVGGETDVLVRTPLVNDDELETEEKFLLSARVVSGITENALGSGSATILDDDSEGVLSITIEDTAGTEGGPLVFDGTFSQPSLEEIVLVFGTTGVTATDGVDYENSDFEYSTDGGVSWLPAAGDAGTEVALAPGTTAFQIRIDSRQDTIDEPDETLMLNATASSGAVAAIFAGTGTVLDDDPPPSVSIGDASAAEGEPLVFEVMLTNPSSAPIVLAFDTTGVSATDGSDYENGNFEYSTDSGVSWLPATGSAGTQVTLPAGTTTFQLRIDSTDDTTDEPDETLMLNATANSGTVASITSGTGTVIDDDPPPTVTIGNSSVGEGEPLVFDVTLANPSSEAIVLLFFTTGVTAADGTDYENGNFEYSTDDGASWLPAGGPAGTEVLLAAETTATKVRIDTNEDMEVEVDETFTLDATASSGMVASITPGTGTILDNDGPPSLTIFDTSAEEGEPLVFDVMLSWTSDVDITLTLSTAGLTATDGVDYENTDFEYSVDGGMTWEKGRGPGKKRIIIPAGMQNVQARIESVEDNDVEGDENFRLDATDNDGNVTSIAPGIGTILDDDAALAISVGMFLHHRESVDSPESTGTGAIPGRDGVDELVTESFRPRSYRRESPGGGSPVKVLAGQARIRAHDFALAGTDSWWSVF